MVDFPRTLVGGISLPRLLIGTNWFNGYSHTSHPKDLFIKDYMSRERITEVIVTFLNFGIDAILGPVNENQEHAIKAAEDRTGKPVIRILTPSFNIVPGGPPDMEPEKVLDFTQKMGATFCLPHQQVTDALVDRMTSEIRDWGKYSKMIRERGMIPGFSTHMPETVVFADKTGLDAETYIQIYNAAGFLMQVEVDWVMRIIRNAQKPVMTIKPLAAGRLLPIVGLAYVWNTIRDCDMVTIGCTTPDEAKEVIELSLDMIERRIPENKLQTTRSKKMLGG
jgi:hypothetical protein